jgi:riboflavin transporter FmnP
MRHQTRRLVLIGVLAAIGFLLMLFELPLPGFPPFLKYDLGGVPSVVAALAMGPGAGAAVELVKNLLFALSGKDPTTPLGPSAAFVAGATLAMVTGWLYRRHTARGRLVLALAVGTVASALVMTLGNYFIFLPLYGVPAGQVAGMAAKVILPFNLVKGVLTGVVVLALTRRLKPETLGW